MYKKFNLTNHTTAVLLTVLFTLGACSNNTKSKGPIKDFERVSKNENAPVGDNWFTKDPTVDGVEGVSADRVYEKLQGSRPSTARSNDVIVAVIDSGVDIHHEDLQGKIWVNEDEVPDNGIDDDNNGYIDDVNGWNFIGGYDADGNAVNINQETLEMTRIYKKYTDKLNAGETLTVEEQQLLDEVTQRIEDESGYNQRRLNLTLELINTLQDTYTQLEALTTLTFTFDEMTQEDLASVESTDQTVIDLRDQALTKWDEYKVAVERPNYSNVNILYRVRDYDEEVVSYYYNPDFDPRSEIVGDDPDDFNDVHYGNNDVIGPDADHGTHVSGIIAANRNNNIGIRGIADHVKIMVLRAVPNGDERDKDVALAVRYAVDNGAQVINMSFGKAYSPFRHKVEEAMQYASDHGVVLVHAAGNDSKNNDVDYSYPTRQKLDGSGDIETWIEVGASARSKDEYMVADFSNYGQTTVDIFAPGHNVESTVPGNAYAIFSGTSMASPSVAGVVALTLEMDSNLSGPDVKQLLLNNGRDYFGLEVILPGFQSADQPTLVPFETLSITGKVASVFNNLRDLLDL